MYVSSLVKTCYIHAGLSCHLSFEGIKKGDKKQPKIEQMFVFIILKCYTHVNTSSNRFSYNE